MSEESECPQSPLQELESICAEIYARWDKDMRSGKLLAALAGMSPGYRADVDRVRAALARVADPSVNRLYRAINGLDGDDADERAETFIYSHIDGWIPKESRALVKLALAQNFEELYQRVAQAKSSTLTSATTETRG